METRLVIANCTQVLFSSCIFFKSISAVITSHSSPNGLRIKRCLSCRDAQIVWDTKRNKIDSPSKPICWAAIVAIMCGAMAQIHVLINTYISQKSPHLGNPHNRHGRR